MANEYEIDQDTYDAVNHARQVSIVAAILSAFGAAFPAKGLAVGMNQGANLQSLTSVGQQGQTGTAVGQALAVGNYLWNGSNLDLGRGNLDVSLLSVSGVTATQVGADQVNVNGNGIKLVFNMTNAGTGSVTPKIQGKDPYTGQYYDMLVGPAVTTNGVTVLTIFPGAPVAANSSANDLWGARSRAWVADQQ